MWILWTIRFSSKTLLHGLGKQITINSDAYSIFIHLFFISCSKLSEQWALLKTSPEHINAKVMPRIWASACRLYDPWSTPFCFPYRCGLFGQNSNVRHATRVVRVGNCGARWSSRNGCILSLGDYLKGSYFVISVCVVDNYTVASN